jgi:hypothetical protein
VKFYIADFQEGIKHLEFAENLGLPYNISHNEENILQQDNEKGGESRLFCPKNKKYRS